MILSTQKQMDEIDLRGQRSGGGTGRESVSRNRRGRGVLASGDRYNFHQDENSGT